MVPIIVILTIVVFVLVDLVLRTVLSRLRAAKQRRLRAEALETGLRIEYTDLAVSLKSVEVPAPKARILAVDDEPVVLDSFRRILVLAGFSIDTVETGQEAIGLVRKRDYDFLFADLKMPGMNGLDVTKAVKHLRPDMDVVIITGYATIESAVAAMKFGAMDYVEKPFTEDELVEFAHKLLIRRQDRIERQTPPTVHLVTARDAGSASRRVINVPGGVYVSPQHTWVGIDLTGEARIGLDDLAAKTLGPVEKIVLPEKDSTVRRGEPLFTLVGHGRELTFAAPVSGRVASLNHELNFHLDLLQIKPYELGWLCTVEPSALTADLAPLRIGADALGWYEEEIATLRRSEATVGREGGQGSEAGRDWDAFREAFLAAAAEPAGAGRGGA